jgi:hypothetical protein
LSSLICNQVVIAVGVITDDGTYYTTPDTIIFKDTAPDAYIISEEPPSVSPTGWYYIDGTFIVIPPVPKPDGYTTIQQQNTQTAQYLLGATDWTATVDINNPQYSNPYLTNQVEFLNYRSQVRNIAITPPTTLAVFPEQPVATWSS